MGESLYRAPLRRGLAELRSGGGVGQFVFRPPSFAPLIQAIRPTVLVGLHVERRCGGPICSRKRASGGCGAKRPLIKGRQAVPAPIAEGNSDSLRLGTTTLHRLEHSIISDEF